MPSRIISQGICTSESMAQLKWFEQVLFIRLVVSADDFGRYDARPLIIKGSLFPLDNTTAKDIESGLQRLLALKMIDLYEVDGKPFLELTGWLRYNTPRAKESKYPSKDQADEKTDSCVDLQADANKCKQMQTDANKCKQVQADESKCPRIRNSYSVFDIRDSDAKTRAKRAPSLGLSDELQSAFEEWLVYKAEKRQPYKETGLKSLCTQVKNKAQEYGEHEVAALIRLCMSSNWQGIIWEKLAESKPAKSGGGKADAHKSAEDKYMTW